MNLNQETHQWRDLRTVVAQSETTRAGRIRAGRKWRKHDFGAMSVRFSLGYSPVTMSEHKTQGMALDNISQLLRAWSDGDQLALGQLTPVVYAELHRLAHRYMRGERPGHSLQTTALVNEAYMRLVDYNRMQWQNRAHFFAVSAQLMRVFWSSMHDVITSNADAACSMSRWMRLFS